jgi:hypothetical protein
MVTFAVALRKETNEILTMRRVSSTSLNKRKNKNNAVQNNSGNRRKKHD